MRSLIARTRQILLESVKAEAKESPESKEFKDEFEPVQITPGIDGVIKGGYGWLTPRGQFYGFGPTKHLQAALSIPGLPPEIKKEGDKLHNELRNDFKDTEASMENGWAPEWHAYQMNTETFTNEFATMLYKARWIRIGRNYQLNVFEFEGIPEALKDKMTYIRKFENQLDPDLSVKITPMI